MGLSFSQHFEASKELLDLTGKVVIVTGGNAGIGYSTVQCLARRGAKVYLAARNESRATAAIAKLEAEGLGSGEVLWLELELSDPRTAKRAAEEFLKRENRLDILVNNAALMLVLYEKTLDGISRIMAVNHIGPFIFTQTLLPLLVQTANLPGADVRIVNVSSDALVFVSPDVRFRDIADFNAEYGPMVWPLSHLGSFSRYAVSKLANVLFTITLQKRLADLSVPIIVLAAHPGIVDTWSHKYRFPRVLHALLSPFAYTPEQGALTSCIAAAGPKIRGESSKYEGAYLKPLGKLGWHPKLAKNGELGEELWGTTEEILKDMGL